MSDSKRIRSDGIPSGQPTGEMEISESENRLGSSQLYGCQSPNRWGKIKRDAILSMDLSSTFKTPRRTGKDIGWESPEREHAGIDGGAVVEVQSDAGEILHAKVPVAIDCGI